MGRSSKTFVVAGATLIAVLILSATALGALSGSAPREGWTATLGAAGPLALGPGATQHIPFVVTNTGRDTAPLGEVTVTIVTEPDGDAATAAGDDIEGCLASWFTASLDQSNRALPPQVTPGASYAGLVDLTMRDSDTPQDACRDAAPAVSVTAG